MKTLIVFYSRTGCTRLVAEALARLLGADLEELRESADRSGARGYMLAGRDALLKRPAELLPTTRRAEDYELVVAATPVWAFTVCPAVRTWLTREAPRLRRLASVCTQGGSGAEGAIAEMEVIARQPSVARLILRDKAVRAQACDDALAEFVTAIRQAVG